MEIATQTINLDEIVDNSSHKVVTKTTNLVTSLCEDDEGHKGPTINVN